MLTTVKGTYDNGRITLHETPSVPEHTEVIVTFLEKEGDRRNRRGGSMKGEVWMADDFNDPLATNRSEAGREGIRLGSWEGKYSLPDDFNDPLDDLADYM